METCPTPTHCLSPSPTPTGQCLKAESQSPDTSLNAETGPSLGALNNKPSSHFPHAKPSTSPAPTVPARSYGCGPCSKNLNSLKNRPPPSTVTTKAPSPVHTTPSPI